MADRSSKTTKSIEKKKNKKGKTIKIVGIVCGVILALALVCYFTGLIILDHYISKVNIVTKETGVEYLTPVITYEDEPVDTEEEEVTTEERPVTGLPDYEAILNRGNLPLISDTKDVTNILLLGVDARRNEASRSDTMILLSINEKTGKIILTSLMRDILAVYPETPANPIYGGQWYDKLCHAHAYGGPELTMAVLKETFNIEVQYYAKVNFYSFVDIIDSVGGVDLELTSDEAWWINQYVLSAETKGLFPDYPKETISVTQEGVYHLNGLQALGHGRNRSIGNDYARTQRQRTIIGQLVKKARGLSLSELDRCLDTLLPLITTNMPKAEIKSLVGKAFSLVKYDVESVQIPQPGTYQSIRYNLAMDLYENVRYLYQKIYEKEPT